MRPALSPVSLKNSKARLAIGLALCGLAVHCSPSTGSGDATGGSAPTTGGALVMGGSSTTGGASTGGNAVTGGTTSMGGVVSTGGAAVSGGSSSTGGSTQAGQPGSTGGAATGAGAGGAPSGTGGATGGTSTGGASNGGASGGNTAGGSVSKGGSGGATSGGSSSGGGGAGKGGAATGGSVTGGSGGSSHTGPWRIVPFGDSITETTCYPQLLSKQLKDANKTNFTFVGSSLNNQSCAGAPTVMSEGHGGYKVTDLVTGGAHASELSGWCTSDDADIVLFHYGTNDAWTPSIPIANILSAYTTVLQCLRGANANVIVFVAKIIPLHPAGCEASTCQYNQRVIELNGAIPGWATSNSTGASPIYVVDVYSAFDADQYLPNSTNTADGVHPNAAGSQLISSKWYEALAAHSLP